MHRARVSSVLVSFVLVGCSADSRETQSLSATGAGTGAAGTDGSSGGSPDTGGDTGTGGGQLFDVGGGDGGPGGTGGNPVDVTCDNIDETASNMGCEFWAVDLPNWSEPVSGVPAAEVQQFAVAVANATSDEMAEVSVYSADDGTPLETALVAPDELHVFLLPEQSVPTTENSYDIAAFRIESDVPVTAYQFQPLDNTVEVFSNDASILFPTHVLTQDYTAITAETYDSAQFPTPAYVSIVAIEDDTVVDVFPSAVVAAGPTQGVALERGRVMTVLSENMPDLHLTGTRVLANKPVAVFSGNTCTLEPVTQGGFCCCDHTEQQMPPLTAWGHAYAAVPPPKPGTATSRTSAYRIVGAFDGTSLVYDPAAPPGAPTSIDANEVVRFETDQPFTVASTDPGKSFAIAQVLMSAGYLSGGGIVPGDQGDPALIVPPAVAQFQTEYVFLTPEAYAANYVTIIRPVGSTTELDGSAVDDGQFQAVGAAEGSAYEHASISLTAGAHKVVGTQPFGILSIGYDATVSYGYAGGSGVEKISIPPVPPG